MKIPDKPRPIEDSGYLPLKPASLDQRAIEKSLFKVLKDIDYMPSRHTSFQCSETEPCLRGHSLLSCFSRWYY